MLNTLFEKIRTRPAGLPSATHTFTYTMRPRREYLPALVIFYLFVSIYRDFTWCYRSCIIIQANIELNNKLVMNNPCTAEFSSTARGVI